MIRPRRAAGYTLIELVISIVVIAIGVASLSVVMVNSFQAIAVTREGDARVRSLEACFEVLLAAEERNGWTWSPGGTAFPGCSSPDYSLIADPAAWGSGTLQAQALAAVCTDVTVACRTVVIPVDATTDATGYQFRLSRPATPPLEFVFPE